MENVIKKKKKILTWVFKHYARDAHTHTHTHTVQTDRSEGQCDFQIFNKKRKWETKVTCCWEYHFIQRAQDASLIWYHFNLSNINPELATIVEHYKLEAVEV